MIVMLMGINFYKNKLEEGRVYFNDVDCSDNGIEYVTPYIHKKNNRMYLLDMDLQVRYEFELDKEINQDGFSLEGFNLVGELTPEALEILLRAVGFMNGIK